MLLLLLLLLLPLLLRAARCKANPLRLFERISDGCGCCCTAV